MSCERTICHSFLPCSAPTIIIAQAGGGSLRLNSLATATGTLPRFDAFDPTPALYSNQQIAKWETTMSRHWHRVSKPIQKLAADLYPIMTEGMFPYEIYYVLATDEEIQRLCDSAAIGS
jgi:hypothetical protein